ncbi:MAG TPA: hypothetical protein ENL08_01820 [Bacteroidetes bacterium]|nr:hypothetical protein [Bacteroidota bacterium]
MVADGKYQISEDHIFQGLLRTNWPGRGEVINDNPVVLLDGAHTPQGAAVLNRLLEDCWPEGRRVFILGFNRDKDLEGFLACFGRAPDAVVATAAEVPRALKPGETAERIRRFGWPADPVGLGGALDRALDHAGGKGVVVVTGSLYLVGAIRRGFLRRRGVLPTLKQDETRERIR